MEPCHVCGETVATWEDSEQCETCHAWHCEGCWGACETCGGFDAQCSASE